MGLFDFLKQANQEQSDKYTSLFKTIKANHPELTEDVIVKISSIAGLLARVAFVDFHLHDDEIKKIESILAEYDNQLKISSKELAQIAIEHVKEMAGLENYLYTASLREVLDRDERFDVLKLLFLVAASDGSVEDVETEEIRLITKGLELSHQHFVAARAEVVDFLRVLKK